MKYLRNLCAALTLLFALSVPTVAGEITTWVVSPPPPPPPASAMATEPGEIGTGGTKSASFSESLLAEITLSVWQLLTVF